MMNSVKYLHYLFPVAVCLFSYNSSTVF